MDPASLTSLANRLYAAEVQAAPQVEESIRLALYRMDGAASPAWGLALVVACWMRQNAGDSLGDLSSTGISPLIDQIQSFEGWFPRSFQKFRETAQAGGDRGSLAAAASYFASALKDLGSIAKQGFLGWLASPKFTSVARALVKRLGGPVQPGASVPSSPAKAFDHADYRVIRTAPPAATPPQPTARLVEAAPEKSDLLLASLLALGWSPEASARILAGPSASPSTPSGQNRPTPAPEVARPEKTAPAQPKRGDAKPEDVAGIPGVIKSGIDLARDIFKTVTASPQPGKGSSPTKAPSAPKSPGKRMSEESPGGFDSSDNDMPETSTGEEDSPSTESSFTPDPEIDMEDAGRITDPSSYVNDSSEVVD